jgi:hypothetical protein
VCESGSCASGGGLVGALRTNHIDNNSSKLNMNNGM